MQKLLDFDVVIEPLSKGYRTRVVASRPARRTPTSHSPSATKT